MLSAPAGKGAAKGKQSSRSIDAPLSQPQQQPLPGKRSFRRTCAGCHGAAGAGTARVPAYGGLIAKRSDADLAKLIQAPDATMKAGGMPPL